MVYLLPASKVCSGVGFAARLQLKNISDTLFIIIKYTNNYWDYQIYDMRGGGWGRKSFFKKIFGIRISYLY
jgi:hypothetical protein